MRLLKWLISHFSIWSLLLILSLLATISCSKKDKATGPDTTPPSVVSTNPPNGATGVAINSTISATFSEPVAESTVTASTFQVANNVTGTVSLSNGGKTVTFDPTTNLHYSTTYTATVTTGIKDLAGNALKANHSWTFSTGVSPVPSANFPLSAGKRWLYSADTKHGYISLQGSGETKFVGDYALYVLDDLILNGKSATRLFLARIPTSQGEPYASYFYLSQNAEGLQYCYGPGAEWCTILSAQSTSFSNNCFLFQGGPYNAAPSQLSLGQITTPAGTFNAVITEHHFKETGEYATHDIWEDNWEYYADGVGLIKSQWHFWDDDNDPMAADYWNDGEVVLKYVDTGPFPELTYESEPNDSAFAEIPRTITIPCLIIGDSELKDAGQIMSDTLVAKNKSGVRIINDWYRFSVPASQTITIILNFEGTKNDIDLYLFRELAGPSLYLSNRSVNSEGQPEKITMAVGSGPWYIGVQAWDTPDGRSNYWISIQ